MFTVLNATLAYLVTSPELHAEPEAAEPAEPDRAIPEPAVAPLA
jgi:hypothetical protein